MLDSERPVIEFYTEIRLVHMATALATGILLLLRGLLLFAGLPRAAMAAALRYLGYTIDTILLTTALMLMTIIDQYPFVDGWLTVKVLLLVAYVVLALLVFHGDAGRRMRFGLWLTALGVYGFIYSVARAHHPAGLLSQLAF